MNIVVVGGGFGGVKTALELARRGVGAITLISSDDTFVHHATLYSTVVGRSVKESEIPIKEIFARYPQVKFVKDTIRKIDAEGRRVQGAKKAYSYDSLVLSLGVVSQISGVNGLQKYSYSASTVEAARELGHTFHDMIISDDKGQIHCAIVGGGMVGVEIAGALSEYAKRIESAHSLKQADVGITLIDAAKRILPELSVSGSRKVAANLKSRGIKIMTGQGVDRVSRSSIVVGGRKIPVDITVWACGGQNNPIFAAHPGIFKLSRRGRVIVNQYLSAYPGIFVIGDNAETPQSGLAVGAVNDAIFIAKHIERIANEKPLRPRPQPRKPLVTIPISRLWAYAERDNVYMAGMGGSLVRRLAELNNYCHFLPIDESWRIWRNHRTAADKCRLCRKSSKNSSK